MNLSRTIAKTEAALHQAVVEDQPITFETVTSLREGMKCWSNDAAELEDEVARLTAENANLRGLLQMPKELSPEVFKGNVVLLGSKR